MENLDDVQQENLQVCQTKVDKYQNDPDLCADLTPVQYVILAELQTIYNALIKRTISNVPSLYNSECVGVRNQMEKVPKIDPTSDSTMLYNLYMRKYQEAKDEPYSLTLNFDLR